MKRKGRMIQTIEYIWIKNNEIKKTIVSLNEPKYTIEELPIVNHLTPCVLFNDPFHPSLQQTHKLVICNIDYSLCDLGQSYYILGSNRKPLRGSTFIWLHECTQACVYAGLNIIYNEYKGDTWEIQLGPKSTIAHSWIMRYILIKYANSMGYFLKLVETELTLENLYIN